MTSTTQKNILVVGSSSIDMIVKTPHLPKTGETVLGSEFNILPGGKGANQAVAVARSGGHVSFIACLGKDVFGENILNGFKKDGINVEGISLTNQTQTGVAQIFVDDNGCNMIAVYPGANAYLSAESLISKQHLMQKTDYVLLQQEIPESTVETAIQMAAEFNKTIILNPAPARKISDALYAKIDYIIPNETEAEILTGIRIQNETDAHKAAGALLEKGVKNVLITLGNVGVYFANAKGAKLFPAFKVKAIDTTAAGDTFSGAFVATLSKGKSVENAIQYAQAASALSVQKIGAQNSVPTDCEVEEFLKQNSI